MTILQILDKGPITINYQRPNRAKVSELISVAPGSEDEATYNAILSAHEVLIRAEYEEVPCPADENVGIAGYPDYRHPKDCESCGGTGKLYRHSSPSPHSVGGETV